MWCNILSKTKRRRGRQSSTREAVRKRERNTNHHVREGKRRLLAQLDLILGLPPHLHVKSHLNTMRYVVHFGAILSGVIIAIVVILDEFAILYYSERFLYVSISSTL
jgi:hypothetical protein